MILCFRIIQSLGLFLAAATLAAARIATAAYDPAHSSSLEGNVAGRFTKDHKLSLSFSAPELEEDENVRLDVLFAHPSSGKLHVVQGSTSASKGNGWRVDFTPDEIGTWRYSAKITTGEGAVHTKIQSTDMTGTFDVAPILTDETGRHLKVNSPSTSTTAPEPTTATVEEPTPAPGIDDATPFPTDSQGNQVRTPVPTVSAPTAPTPVVDDETPFPTDSQGNQVRTQAPISPQVPTVTPVLTVSPTVSPVTATAEPASIATTSPVEATVPPTPIAVPTASPTSTPTSILTTPPPEATIPPTPGIIPTTSPVAATAQPTPVPTASPPEATTPPTLSIPTTSPVEATMPPTPGIVPTTSPVAATAEPTSVPTTSPSIPTTSPVEPTMPPTPDIVPTTSPIAATAGPTIVPTSSPVEGTMPPTPDAVRTTSPVIATAEPTSGPTTAPIVTTTKPTSAPTTSTVETTGEPTIEASSAPTVGSVPSPPALQCSTPCTQASDCADTANLQGLNPECGSLECVSGTCRYEAWNNVGTCVDTNFVQCSGDDSMCTKGPGALPFVGTCTGYQFIVCFYSWCPVLPASTTEPTTSAPTTATTAAPAPVPALPTSEPTAPTPTPTIETVPTSSPVATVETMEPTTQTQEGADCTSICAPGEEMTLPDTVIEIPAGVISVPVDFTTCALLEAALEESAGAVNELCPFLEMLYSEKCGCAPIGGGPTSAPTILTVGPDLGDCPICPEGLTMSLPATLIEIPPGILSDSAFYTTCGLLELAILDSRPLIEELCPRMSELYSDPCGCVGTTSLPTSGPTAQIEEENDCPICPEGQVITNEEAVVTIPSGIFSDGVSYATCGLLELATKDSRETIDPLCASLPDLYAETCECKDPSSPSPTGPPAIFTEPECAICPAGEEISRPDTVIEIPDGYVSDGATFVTCQLLENALAETPETLLSLCPRLEELFAGPCGCREVTTRETDISTPFEASAVILPNRILALGITATFLFFFL